ncbi:MAG: YncE family protein [Nitrospirae bacterium]|nr:YncE family protein [Nitrospirota bacterium]
MKRLESYCSHTRRQPDLAAAGFNNNRRESATKRIKGDKMKRYLVLALLVFAVLAFGVVSAEDAPKLSGVAYIQGHGGHIAVMDLATGELARYSHGKPADTVQLSTDKKTLYVFSLDGFEKEIDVESGKQSEWMKFGKKHCGSAIAPDGTIWVSDMDDGHVYVFDPKAKKLVDSFPVSKSICSIAFSKDGKTAYIGDMPGGFVSAVDVKTKKVTGQIKDVGLFIHRGRIRPGTDEMWQSDGAELKDGKPAGVGYTEGGSIPGSVTIIDTKANKVIDKVLIGGNPHDVDFTHDGKYAIVSTRQVPDQDDSALVVVNAANRRVVDMRGACKLCHFALNLAVPKKTDDGRPYLCAVQIDWDRKGIPAGAENIMPKDAQPMKHTEKIKDISKEKK